MDAGHGDPEWIVNKERYKYDALFDTLSPVDGKVTGAGKTLCLLIILHFHLLFDDKQIGFYLLVWFLIEVKESVDGGTARVIGSTCNLG